jgi:hypothetical protein
LFGVITGFVWRDDRFLTDDFRETASGMRKLLAFISVYEQALQRN